MSSTLDAKAHFDAQHERALSLLQQDPAAALAIAEALNKSVKQYKNPSWGGLALRLLAKCQRQLGDKPRAISTLQTAIRYLKRNQLMQQCMQCYNELGTLLFEQLEYYPALDAWLKSLEIATALQAYHGCVRAYLGVGKVHFACGDYRKAQSFHLIAQQLSQPLQDKELDCEVALNLAADAYRLAEYDEALIALSQISQHILNDLNQPEWEAEVLTYDGLIHLHFERYSEAQELLSQAYQHFRKNHLIGGQGQVMIALAKCFIALNQIDLAEECLQEGARLGHEHQLLQLAVESHTQLAQLYLDSAQYPLALQQRKILHTLIASQYGELGLAMQLPGQTQARLRRVERELELRKTTHHLMQFVAHR